MRGAYYRFIWAAWLVLMPLSMLVSEYRSAVAARNPPDPPWRGVEAFNPLSWAPPGHAAFCAREPGECLPGTPGPVSYNATRYAELHIVNADVNRIIRSASDRDTYGTLEYYALPYTQGDCEDKALLKRHELIRRGWPVGALLLTAVEAWDEDAERYGGHMVLSVLTSDGTLILDNFDDEVRWESEAREYYRFTSRQATHDPNLWLRRAR
jgi:predicted transglutaminase-like cysteine proteinase